MLEDQLKKSWETIAILKFSLSKQFKEKKTDQTDSDIIDTLHREIGLQKEDFDLFLTELL